MIAVHKADMYVYYIIVIQADIRHMSTTLLLHKTILHLILIDYVTINGCLYYSIN